MTIQAVLSDITTYTLQEERKVVRATDTGETNLPLTNLGFTKATLSRKKNVVVDHFLVQSNLFIWFDWLGNHKGASACLMQAYSLLLVTRNKLRYQVGAVDISRSRFQREEVQENGRERRGKKNKRREREERRVEWQTLRLGDHSRALILNFPKIAKKVPHDQSYYKES